MAENNQAGGLADVDPRGLIREAYRIEHVGPGECRSIFLDWALGVGGSDLRPAIRRLLGHYGQAHPQHPMTAVLQDGLSDTPAPRRRGGAGARRG